jgi:hypothetical protein
MERARSSDDDRAVQDMALDRYCIRDESRRLDTSSRSTQQVDAAGREPCFPLAILGAALWHLRHFDLGSSRADRLVPTSEFWPLFVMLLPGRSALGIHHLPQIMGDPALRYDPSAAQAGQQRTAAGLFRGGLFLQLGAPRRQPLTTSPFGAVKDVTILSAMIGNVVTITPARHQCARCWFSCLPRT